LESKQNKIVKFPKKRNINVSVITFALVIVYLTVSMIMYMTRDKVTFYEVIYGKNATAANKSYNALIVRDETVFYANEAGYVNYYIGEGGRASLNSVVYSIDEGGTIAGLLAEQEQKDNSLSESDINKIRNDIANYIKLYDNISFDDVYDFKNDLESTVLEYLNTNLLNNLYELIEQDAVRLFNLYKAELTGIVAFYNDGFENYSANNISEADFDLKSYNKNVVKANSLINKGDFVYKVINNEEWSLFFKLSDEEYTKYRNKTLLTIKLLEKGLECTGKFTTVIGKDGYYGKVTLDSFMSEFSSDRYTEIKIVESQTKGLKIPKTSVVEKEFYIIPVSYVGKGGNSTTDGFFKQVIKENGEISIEFITPDIYYKSDEYYYVSMDDFTDADVIMMNDSSSVHRIGQTGMVKGVYNINNGYCVFKVIDIIGETSDYYIVSDSTNYGLVVYDHIVLDGSMVEENKVIFKVE